MTDTISISPKPGIKCFAGDNKLCSTLLYITANITLKKVKKLTGVAWLWTGESAFCICTHHVEHHFTVRDNVGQVKEIYCHSRYEDGELCNCGLFRTRSIRLDQKSFRSNVDEMAEEDLANVQHV